VRKQVSIFSSSLRAGIIIENVVDGATLTGLKVFSLLNQYKYRLINNK
jgi:hypothetical protein